MPPKRKSSALETDETYHGDVYKRDTDGYNVLQIISALQDMDAIELTGLFKPANFRPWLQTGFGVQASQCHRVLAIVTSEIWRDVWGEYVETAYGQSVFNFSTAEANAHTKLERVRLFFFGTSVSMRLKQLD